MKYIEYGKENNEVIMMLHGGGLSWWNYRKEAYGFFFEFIRTNVYINVHINKKLNIHEQEVFNLILNNELISKKEISIKMNKSEKTIQRIISSLIKKK